MNDDSKTDAHSKIAHQKGNCSDRNVLRNYSFMLLNR